MSSRDKIVSSKVLLASSNSENSLRVSGRNRIRSYNSSVEHTFLAFYKAKVFNQRLNYKTFFSEEIVKYWELYLNELQLALSQLEEHEKRFLENCCLKRASHKNSFFSKATYYRCLNQYSIKFLSLFDYELFHIRLANIYLKREPLLLNLSTSVSLES